MRGTLNYQNFHRLSIKVFGEFQNCLPALVLIKNLNRRSWSATGSKSRLESIDFVDCDSCAYFTLLRNHDMDWIRTRIDPSFNFDLHSAAGIEKSLLKAKVWRMMSPTLHSWAGTKFMLQTPWERWSSKFLPLLDLLASSKIVTVLVSIKIYYVL